MPMMSRRNLFGYGAQLAATAGFTGYPLSSLLAAPASQAGHYLPTVKSLNTHPVPSWFEDGKLGIFIHWGLFSVPGYAPKGKLDDVLRNDFDRAMVVDPYAEDYWNALRDPTTPTAKFHREHYGAMPYQGFREMFNKGLSQWSPSAWAKEFSDTGATYVVLTAKYADGYCLWPSKIKNRHEPNWISQRDVVGELAAACRAEGMKFGVYYSGGVDWAFTREPMRTLGEYLNHSPGGDFPEYAISHIHELVEHYKVDVLWNDICWCTDAPDLYKLFAYYYNALPEGVVNDRWGVLDAQRASMANPKGWAIANKMMQDSLKEDPNFFDRKPEPPPHSDFLTPEWVQFSDIQTKKWEVCRSIGTSWGYKRTETDADYESAENLTFQFIDAVSKNGNMLLNVGPRGEDAQIPDIQLSRLRGMGKWIRPNKEAIRGTRPWKQPSSKTSDGLEVRFTSKGSTVYAIIWGRPTSGSIRIKNLDLAGSGRHLSSGTKVVARKEGADVILDFERPLGGELGPTVALG